MDKEKNNSNIEPKVTISDLAERATTTEPKPKKRIGLGIMATVLILLLVGGALAIGYLWGNNTAKPTETNNPTANNGNTTQPEESVSTNTDENNVISATEAGKILEKYIGEGNRVSANPLNAFYNTFVSNFDDQQKAFLAYNSIDRDKKEGIECVDEWHEQGQCTGKSISYDLLNEKYQSLFGNYNSIEKKDYAFHGFFYLVYDNKINAYREFILPGGGITPIIAIHKIIDVSKNNEDMVVSMMFAQTDVSIKVPSESCESGATLFDIEPSKVDDMIDSMSMYEFTLSPYNDSYILTAVKKIE